MRACACKEVRLPANQISVPRIVSFRFVSFCFVSFRFVGFDAGRPLVRDTFFWGCWSNVPIQWLPLLVLPSLVRLVGGSVSCHFCGKDSIELWIPSHFWCAPIIINILGFLVALTSPIEIPHQHPRPRAAVVSSRVYRNILKS